MKERELICGRENVESFKKELKTALPGSFSFIKGLYEAGMIKGIRGIKLTYTAQESENEQAATQPAEQQQYCGDCQAYQPDAVGFGDGVGQCTENIKTRRTKNPMTEACSEYKKVND